jgi:hypothetical protein
MYAEKYIISPSVYEKNSQSNYFSMCLGNKLSLLSKHAQGEDYKGIICHRRSSLSPGQTICFGDVPHSLLASNAAHILPENKFTMRFRIIPVPQVLKHDTNLCICHLPTILSVTLSTDR